MTRNYKLIIAYDGTRYHGWERQPGHDMTIQGKLENVLARMTGAEEGSFPDVIGSGRTDAGVHARGQVASVVLDTELSPCEIQRYMNTYLPEDISVVDVKEASSRFHARYNAIGKTYRYNCWVGSGKPVFDRRFVTVLGSSGFRDMPQSEDKAGTSPGIPELDIEGIRKAAAHLTGTHDFKSFCGNSHFKKSSVRHLDTINIETGGNYLRFYYHGNSFLTNMVRILTGTLLEVGYGRMSPAYMDTILEGCDRNLAGPTAPPQGLCLMKVDY